MAEPEPDPEVRAALPGDDAPPLAGKPWRKVKLAAWGVALATLLGLAALGAVTVTTIAGKAPGWISSLERPAITTVNVNVPNPDAVTTPEPGLGDHDQLPVIRYISPRWITPPRPQFPAEALRAGVSSASVVLECSTSVDGGLEQCRVAEERPEGFGFGAAALEAVSAARVSPAQIEDAPTEAMIRFRTQFRLD